jgi:ankyrin repeat protein
MGLFDFKDYSSTFFDIDWTKVKPRHLKRFNPNQKDSKGYSPLHYAADYCRDIRSDENLWIFEKLIELGANIKDEPVHYRIAVNPKLLELFIKHEANFSLDALGSVKDFKSLQLLIDYGVVNNASPSDLDDAFLSYVISNQISSFFSIPDNEFDLMANKLIELGAELQNPSPLCFLRVGGVGFISENDHITNYRDRDKMILKLLKWGASIKDIAYEGLTPLNLVAFYCGADIVNKFLECGAKPDDNFVLFSAVSTGNVEVVELLLKAGANPNAYIDVDEFKQYFGNYEDNGTEFSVANNIPSPFEGVWFTVPLHLACSQISYYDLHHMTAQTEIVKLLIDYGADVNITTCLGPKRTALDFALYSKNYYDEITEVEMTVSNKPSIIDIQWNNSYTMFREIVEILKQAGAKYHKTTHTSERTLTNYKD